MWTKKKDGKTNQKSLNPLPYRFDSTKWSSSLVLHLSELSVANEFLDEESVCMIDKELKYRWLIEWHCIVFECWLDVVEFFIKKNFSVFSTEEKQNFRTNFETLTFITLFVEYSLMFTQVCRNFIILWGIHAINHFATLFRDPKYISHLYNRSVLSIELCKVFIVVMFLT